MNPEKEMCGLCNQPINDGKHNLKVVEVGNGLKIQTCDCPYYVGFDGKPVILIPKNQEEEETLKELKEDLYKREKKLLEQNVK